MCVKTFGTEFTSATTKSTDAVGGSNVQKAEFWPPVTIFRPTAFCASRPIISVKWLVNPNDVSVEVGKWSSVRNTAPGDVLSH